VTQSSNAASPLPQPVALVTGAAQGIGKGITVALLAAGYGVTILDSDAEALAETLAELAPSGPIIGAVGDVAEDSVLAAAVAQVTTTWGRLDALVNNAGIGCPARKLEDLPLTEWQRVLAVDLTAPMLAAKHAIPWLRRAKGAIVNISSVRALYSEPNSFAYTAAKGGLLALTHSLAISLGPEVRCNAICPGWIETSGWRKTAKRRPPRHRPEDHSQHPVGRVGTPEDIASLTRFLLSAEAGFITGQHFVVDGGITSRLLYVP
jgi:NAD(P)-dependent dehydrogenase (short-subunit alcohol dehydrogenase family)